MEISDVKLRPERRLGLATQRLDAKVADLVPERLTGPHDVTLDFGLDVARRQGRVCDHVVDRLLPRPGLGVQSRIDHEPHGPQLFVVEPAEPLVRVGEETELRTEELRIQCPAFDVRGVVSTEAAEARQPHELLLDRLLEVVAWRRLVQRKRLHAEARLRFQVVGVDVEDAGARAVGGGLLIVGARGRAGPERFDLAHFVIGLRKYGEQPRQCGVDPLLD